MIARPFLDSSISYRLSVPETRESELMLQNAEHEEEEEHKTRKQMYAKVKA
jgi:hypothetical protein